MLDPADVESQPEHAQVATIERFGYRLPKGSSFPPLEKNHFDGCYDDPLLLSCR